MTPTTSGQTPGTTGLMMRTSVGFVMSDVIGAMALGEMNVSYVSITGILIRRALAGFAMIIAGCAMGV